MEYNGHALKRPIDNANMSQPTRCDYATLRVTYCCWRRRLIKLTTQLSATHGAQTYVCAARDLSLLMSSININEERNFSLLILLIDNANSNRSRVVWRSHTAWVATCWRCQLKHAPRAVRRKLRLSERNVSLLTNCPASDSNFNNLLLVFAVKRAQCKLAYKLPGER